jgi:hypothetical protein
LKRGRVGSRFSMDLLILKGTSLPLLFSNRFKFENEETEEDREDN